MANENIIKKILNITINTLLVIVILIVSSLTIQKVIYKDEDPNILGLKILKVMSRINVWEI